MDVVQQRLRRGEASCCSHVAVIPVSGTRCTPTAALHSSGIIVVVSVLPVVLFYLPLYNDACIATGVYLDVGAVSLGDTNTSQHHQCCCSSRHHRSTDNGTLTAYIQHSFMVPFHRKHPYVVLPELTIVSDEDRREEGGSVHWELY